MIKLLEVRWACEKNNKSIGGVNRRRINASFVEDIKLTDYVSLCVCSTSRKKGGIGLSSFEKEYLSIIIGQLKHFKERAEKGIHQLSEDELH